MTYTSPFPSFATPDLNQRAAALWLSLLSAFAIADTLGLMMLEQLAFSHWAAQELARKQSRDLAAGADPDSPAMLRLSRERRAECRLQAQLARQLKQHIKSSKPSDSFTSRKIEISKPSNSTYLDTTTESTPHNTSLLDSLYASVPNLDDLLSEFTKAAITGKR